MQPTIYSQNHHKIPREKVDPDARFVLHKLREAGHKAYLVGGGVRDLLLGLDPKDFDISTSARPEEIRSLFRNALLIGRRFRLAHIRFGKKIIEVATFRRGETESDSLIVRDNEWGSEEEDVLRRDFTINGLFYNLETEEVLDYVGGVLDVEKGILRMIGDPTLRFRQDPVRMIRLLKFSARLGFHIDPPTLSALLECKKEITKSSSARVLEELLRMLESGSSKRFFHLLQEYGILQALLPELSHFFHMQKETNPLSLLEEIDSERKKEGKSPDRTLLLASLLYPLFETYVETLSQKKPLHLGEMTQAAHYVIDCIFSPFFSLPKRMRAIVGFLLSNQFRFVPLNKELPRKKPRLSTDPFFPAALQLLKWRSSISASLLPHYTLWTEAVFAAHGGSLPEIPEEAPRRRRRRRR